MKSFICNLRVLLVNGVGEIWLGNKSMMDNSCSERRPWSEEEDEALRTLYEDLQANRWNLIAERLQSEFGFGGRSGKQCRQRYNNHLDPSLSKDEWSPSEELALFRLHDQLGNKWAVISQRLSTGRTDNTVKNHFYSRLRKSLRRLNKVLYKIIEACEEAFKEEPMCSTELSQFGCELKNRILMVTDEGAELEETATRELIDSINEFNHAYKRKPKKLRRTSCSYARQDQDSKFLPPPKLKSFPDKAQRPTSFCSLSHKNSLSCPLEDEQNAKIEIRSDSSLKLQTQKLITPIILTANCNSLPFAAYASSKSEQTLSALGLLEEGSIASYRHLEACSESDLKHFDESSAEVKAEPLSAIPPGRLFNH